MTVAELTARLQELPQDAIIAVRSYEDGVNEADHITLCRIKPSTLGPEWYYGSYEATDGDGMEAVFISSTRDDIRE